MCRTNSEDPLVRAFLDRYHLNLLSIPRENVACGDLYVVDDLGNSTPGNLEHILDPPVQISSAVRYEKLADLGGIISTRVEAKVGLNLFDNFLAAAGFRTVVGSIKSQFVNKKVRYTRFRFKDAYRDYIDPLELGSALQHCALRQAHPFINKQNRYYVVTGVVRTTSITICAEDDKSNAVDMDVGVIQTSEAKASLYAHRSLSGEITYQGPKSLAIGVELHEMIYVMENRKLLLKAQKKALQLRKAVPPTYSPVSWNSENDDIFVSLAVKEVPNPRVRR